ncbi:exosortase A [Thiorhodovibrio winogradskyi]|uniref:Exosortase A n=1 Tax=Thiorhodovibrio winogradskyi TaxID=77007 RepID=A0ABZ0SBH1_9GAMM|nr:exosortase A [Thiorhodovibrio winogradskyi]
MNKFNNTWLLMGLILLIPAVFPDTTWSMVKVWAVNETFTHGFLVFPISLWLIWQDRTQINQITLTSNPLALVLAIPVLAIWTLGALVDIKVVQQLALITLIPLTVWTLLGWNILRAVLFPLCYLLFAVPLGQELIPPLMDFTADFTVALIRLSGVPVYQDGLYFTLPSGNWSVVEECSGVRYLIASLALGTIYAYMVYQKLYKRIIFFLFACAIPILANGLRAYMIVMIGHFSGMKYAVGADHLLYGWVFFGIVIFLMFYIGGIWRDPQPELPVSNGKPLSNSPTSLPKNALVPVIMLATLLTVTKLFTAYLMDPPADEFKPAYVEVVDQFGDWHKRDSLGFDWAPIFNNPDRHLNQGYEHDNGKETLRLDIGYFRYQRDGAEAVSSLNRLSDPYGGDWKIIASRTSHDGNHQVQETEIQKGGQKILVWSWYRVGDQAVANSTEAKLRQLANKFLSQRDDASMITLATEIRDEVATARARLNQFKLLLDQDVFLAPTH